MPNSLDTIHILLADDDKDDTLLFKEVLDELPLSTHLTTVGNGEQLMQLLAKTDEQLPDVLFLDLNMPRKNGFACLSEIKHSEKLKLLSVIIYSTSYEDEVASLLFENGATYYIRKPSSYTQLKKLIYKALMLSAQAVIPHPSRAQFVLS